MSGNKQLIVRIRLFQTKMLCGTLQNTSVAQRRAMAHRLKTTAIQCYLSYHHDGNLILNVEFAITQFLCFAVNFETLFSVF